MNRNWSNQKANPALKTVSRWNGVKGQENDKKLHTTPEDWKYKSIKWMCGETFWGRHTAQPQELC